MGANLNNIQLNYREKINASVRELLLGFECQPILFVGSGLSRRYVQLPNWLDLLKHLFSYIPKESGKFEYYMQKFDGNAIKVGSALADLVFEWAWNEGRNNFPEELFTNGANRECFVKYLCCRFINENKFKLSTISPTLKAEVEALSQVRPHAVITTNYDLLLEHIFDGYETISGQTILRYNANSFGEIFHIHGDVQNPKTIVFTENDYNEWKMKKKYLSAKLLTYFAEHPVFILGYGLNDPNIKEILMDIGELVANDNGVIDNVYQVIWSEKPLAYSPPDHVIIAQENREYKIRAIYLTEFNWLFNALKSRSSLETVNLKLVRALAARTMKLIREDIPMGKVSINYDVLERINTDDEELPKLLGISKTENPNQTHPLTLSQVAIRLGFTHWSYANKLIKKIIIEKEIDIRASDNVYHCKIKTGTAKGSISRKFSFVTIDLLKKVRDGEPYDLVI